MDWDEDSQTDDATDPEGPDATEMNDDPADVQCPYCKREISEDAERCPFCGSYVSIEDGPQRRQWWWLVALILLVLLLLAYLLKH